MSAKSMVEATRQLPCSVVILSARADGKQGAMTASAMYVSEIPPLIAVSVSKQFATYQLIEKSREFAVNVITDDQIGLAKKLGDSHGQDVDKFSEFGIATTPASQIKAPLVAGCYANIECQVKTALWDVEGNHAIYIGEVVAFKSNKDLGPLVWLKNRYFKVGAECRL
ncbi:MAG: flavin reductase family protein [Chloroflexota bacterium]